MLHRTLPALALAAALAPALGGCGSDALSAAQLHARASAICRRTAQATDRIPLPSTPDEGGRFLAQGIARLRPAAARLGALKPPHDVRARYERAVQLAGQEIALIARHERAIAHGEDPIATFRALQAALDPLTTEENAYWRGLGIPACVRR
jgi:hypothetical protein